MLSHYDEVQPEVAVNAFEVDEIITLFDNRFLREHRSQFGWKQETGMLERRLERSSVAAERRRSALRVACEALVVRGTVSRAVQLLRRLGDLVGEICQEGHGW